MAGAASGLAAVPAPADAGGLQEPTTIDARHDGRPPRARGSGGWARGLKRRCRPSCSPWRCLLRRTHCARRAQYRSVANREPRGPMRTLGPQVFSLNGRIGVTMSDWRALTRSPCAGRSAPPPGPGRCRYQRRRFRAQAYSRADERVRGPPRPGRSAAVGHRARHRPRGQGGGDGRRHRAAADAVPQRPRDRDDDDHRRPPRSAGGRLPAQPEHAQGRRRDHRPSTTRRTSPPWWCARGGRPTSRTSSRRRSRPPAAPRARCSAT